MDNNKSEIKSTKRKSIQKSTVIDFIIALAVVIALFIIEFFVFVEPSVSNKIIEINIQDPTSISDLISLGRRSLMFSIINIILISVILMKITSTKTVQPIKQLNDATKKVINRRL